MLALSLSSFVAYLREACESALKEQHSLTIAQTEGFVDEAIDSNSSQLEALGQVFSKAAETDLPSEVGIVYLFLNLLKRFRSVIS